MPSPERLEPPLVPLRRVSQVPRPVFRRAPPPITPESPAAANARCFTAGVRLHHLWQTGRSRWCYEAESGSLALQLAPSPREASHPPDYSDPRSLGYVLNGQLT